MENIISNYESSNNKPNINPTKIKVIGVGGGGGNAVNRMMQAKLAGVEFWLMNTDLQDLSCSSVPNKLQLGAETTGGLGCGADPATGEKAALETKDQITKALDNTDMLFITAGMGGGTGTGAAPVVAQIAQDLGILTIAFVTKPFFWEGNKRMKQAEDGIEKLKKYVDAILVVPNDKLLQVVERQIGVREAFCVTDEVLYRGIQGLSDIITIPGMINIDFADVKKVVKNSGTALMGIGRASGEGRAVKAAEMAINSQLLESSIDGASGIIVNITGSPQSMTLYEFNDAANVINNVVKDDADVIIGTSFNDAMQNEIQITVIATGFAEKTSRMSAADYFKDKTPLSGSTTTTSTTSGSSTPAFEFPKLNLDVPDFLKKN
ncbi:MAG: cell division protein FtsZ [Cyanobacteriota bacterium]|nr:cell division protein FtsZ [Cyanobacteriota bacterium]